MSVKCKENYPSSPQKLSNGLYWPFLAFLETLWLVNSSIFHLVCIILESTKMSISGDESSVESSEPSFPTLPETNEEDDLLGPDELQKFISASPTTVVIYTSLIAYLAMASESLAWRDGP